MKLTAFDRTRRKRFDVAAAHVFLLSKATGNSKNVITNAVGFSNAARIEIRIVANQIITDQFEYGLGLLGVGVMLAVVKVCHAALDARIVAQWEHAKLFHTFTTNYFFT
jgi:hypothetical protein